MIKKVGEETEKSFHQLRTKHVIDVSPTFKTYKEDKGVLHHVREDSTMDSGKKVHIRAGAGGGCPHLASVCVGVQPSLKSFASG